MKFVNLTPHSIRIRMDESASPEPLDTDMVFQPDGTFVARVETQQERQNDIDGIPVYVTSFGDVIGLPDSEPETVYIVSILVAQRAQRDDVLSPLTDSTAVRKDGQIFAVRGLQR